MTVETPSRVPSSRTGWPALRTPRWMLAGAVVLLAGMVLAAWPTNPSNGQRASDLRGVAQTLSTDIQSCAAGVTDTLMALHAIQDHTSTDVGTAESIVNDAVNNCSPVNNSQMEDLIEYAPPESLATYHLSAAVQDLWTWASPLAQRVQADVGALIAAQAHGSAAIASATTQLHKDQQALDAERATIDKFFTTASHGLSTHVAPPPLPS
jgi:hypothetical protein